MERQVDNGRRGPGRLRLPGAARRAAAGWPSGSRTSPATGPAEDKTAKGTILLAVVLAVMAMAAVAAAPALAQTSGDPPDYVLKEDGTVVIDGDVATDCPSFALSLEQGYELAGNPKRAQAVLEQCKEAGLLPPGGTTSSASAGASVAAGEGGALPDTGGPDLLALLVLSSLVAMTGAFFLLRKAAR